MPSEKATQNCRTIKAWFGLEETFKGQLTQTPCHGQGCLSLDCHAQGPSKPAFNISNNGEPMTSPDNMLQCPHRSHSKKNLPYIQPKSTHFHFRIPASCPVTTCAAKLFFHLSFPVIYWKAGAGSSQTPLVSRMYNTSSLSLSSPEKSCSLLIILMVLLWSYSNRSMPSCAGASCANLLRMPLIPPFTPWWRYWILLLPVWVL